MTLLRMEFAPGATRAAAVPVLRGMSRFTVRAVAVESGAGTRGLRRVAPDVVCVEVAFGDGPAQTFCCAVGAPYQVTGL
jgi:hypothetical protein